MLPQRRALVKPLNGEECAELAHVATDPLAPPTEQDKEAGENEHERDVEGSGQQVVPRRQQRDEPEDDAGDQEHTHELGVRDDGSSILLPATAASEEKSWVLHLILLTTPAATFAALPVAAAAAMVVTAPAGACAPAALATAPPGLSDAMILGTR